MAKTVIGIDWGTTNRRAYVLDGEGKLVRSHSDHSGILAVNGDFENSLRQLLQTLDIDGGEVIMSGMVGSRNGWQQVPYLDVEQPVDRLRQAMAEIPVAIEGIRCRIVPGMKFVDSHGVPDVMRGEETQILGALASGAPDGWFVLPGTHSKWVRMEGRHIRRVATFMTGELYSLLSKHGTLAALMQDEQPAPRAFEAGLDAAQRSGFTHAAFGCRALVVTDAMPASHAASYLSGLLIGAEIAEVRREAGRRPVQIIGSPELAKRYVAALDHADMQSRIWPPDDVYLAALKQLSE